MEKIVVIVFDTESAARQGVRALHDLEDEARIVLYELAAIRRNEDGTMSRLREDNDFPAPSATIAGAALGSLIGLLAGGITATERRPRLKRSDFRQPSGFVRGDG